MAHHHDVIRFRGLEFFAMVCIFTKKEIRRPKSID